MNGADPLIGDYGSRNGAKVERRTPTVLRVIVLGYITAVAMPPVGLVIGIVLALHRPTGRSKHWLWIVIVSLVAAVLWFLIIKSGVFNTTNSDLSY